MNNHFQIITTSNVKEVAKIREAFRKKHILEKQVAQLIKKFEEETGLAIDMIRYQRDITLPIKDSKYLSMHVIITPEDDERTEDA